MQLGRARGALGSSRKTAAAQQQICTTRKPCRSGRSLGLKVLSVAQAPQIQKSPDEAASAAADAKAVVPHRRAPQPVKKAEKLMNIVFITSEVAPWAKTGGLADVLSSLPIALAARGHRVMVVVPRYANYPEAKDTGAKVHLQGSDVGYYHFEGKGVDWVFVDQPDLYQRVGGIYGDENGVYGDNQYRYMILSLAGLEAPFHIKLPEEKGGMYGQDIVFVGNDWHGSLVPVYLAAKYRAHGVYKDSRAILAIHNLRHQGVYPPGTFEMLGLPSHWWGCMEWQYPPWQRQGAYAEEGRAVNSLKAGITTADRIVTVSPGYAEEIKTYLGGWGLESLLTDRNYVLSGIVNGIDYDEWSPEVDPHLPVNYGIEDFVEGKKACKRALQQELGLSVNENIPLLAFIGRLDPQKGADILLEAAPGLLDQGVQLVCLGSGNKDLEEGLRWLESKYKHAARGWVGFNVPFSHRLTAAADILLMPSRFEPCGLNQLYAMRYGTVPVAHKTGGLKDTVTDFDPWAQKGTGWTYTDCTPEGLTWATSMAIKTWKHHNEDFRKLQLRGMERDGTWDKAAQDWEQVFNWAKMDQPYAG